MTTAMFVVSVRWGELKDLACFVSMTLLELGGRTLVRTPFSADPLVLPLLINVRMRLCRTDRDMLVRVMAVLKCPLTLWNLMVGPLSTIDRLVRLSWGEAGNASCRYQVIAWEAD